MRYSYATNFYPPAPLIDITVTLPPQARITNQISSKALVDTGSDITVIPQNIIDNLSLMPCGELTAQYSDGMQHKEIAYAAIVVVNGLRTKLLPIIGSTRRSYALLGRDFINDVILRLEYRNSFFELTP
ncbi:retroviral-like aspartic protease family protein [Omnitrophica bacterium]|nr:retroviral-like aspartic protease family protein [Candidatus Omnitrophota bacterium]